MYSIFKCCHMYIPWCICTNLRDITCLSHFLQYQLCLLLLLQHPLDHHHQVHHQVTMHTHCNTGILIRHLTFVYVGVNCPLGSGSEDQPMNGTCNESFVHFCCSSQFVCMCTGSCVLRGFRGCCIALDFESGSCVGTCGKNGSVCYCDQVCHQFGDCCPDVLEIGCLPSELLKLKLFVKYIYIQNLQLFSMQEMMDLEALEVDLWHQQSLQHL